MAYFPDVHKGDTFVPDALLSNNLRHIVNAMNGHSGGITKGIFPNEIKIQVYNNTGEILPAGTAVNFDETGEFYEDAVPCKKFTVTDKNWGILTEEIAPEAIGSCIVSGRAKVTLSGGAGNYAVPDTSNPGQFIRSGSGAKIIFANTAGEALIVLGSGDSSRYQGYFTVSLVSDNDSVKIRIADGSGDDTQNAGVAFINEQIIWAPQTELNLSSGKYVLAKFQLNDTAVNFVEFVQSDTLDSNGSETFTALLATLIFPPDGGYPAVCQQQYGPIYGWIFRECTEEDFNNE